MGRTRSLRRAIPSSERMSAPEWLVEKRPALLQAEKPRRARDRQRSGGSFCSPGKRPLLAATGAGQHAVAPLTPLARLGLASDVLSMGSGGIRRQGLKGPDPGDVGALGERASIRDLRGVQTGAAPVSEA